MPSVMASRNTIALMLAAGLLDKTYGVPLNFPEGPEPP